MVKKMLMFQIVVKIVVADGALEMDWGVDIVG